MPKDHIDETSYPYMDAAVWRAGRRGHCGREATSEHLLSYESFRERFEQEGARSLCVDCGNKCLPML